MYLCLICHIAAALAIASATAVAEQMVFPGSEWEEATPESQGLDSAKLDEALNYMSSFIRGKEGVTRTVVIRNGYLIWKGSDIHSRNCVFSVTKSFASTVLGHLIDNGKCTLETLAKDHASLDLSDYPGVTLRHFATMTSGYDSEGPTWERNGLTTPLKPVAPVYEPGTKFNYSDHAMHLYGYVLTMIAGMDLDSYFRQHIARPIGMEDTSWEWLDHYDDCNFDFSNPDNADVRSAAGGLWINADALARFGHLFLNRGNWNGEQIISEEWVDQATVNQVPVSTPLHGDYGATRVGAGRNGYNWWVNGTGKDGRLLWPDAPPRTYAAVGAHNNWCWVIPEWNMVIVRIGRDNPHYVGNFGKGYETFFTILSQAIMDSHSERKDHDQ